MLRIFYNNPFAKQMVIDDSEVVHHLAVVLRIKPGQEVFLVNNNLVARTTVTCVSKSEIEVLLEEEYGEDNELPVAITLGFAPLKGDNTQLVIQKAVELGASHIDLINFKRNVSKFDSKKAANKITKFEKIIDGACNQSRRNHKPTIEVNVNLSEDYLTKFDLIIVCYENENSNHLLKYSKEIMSSENVLVLIGPEGGIDESEIAKLEQNENVVIATLGARILRAETASIASLSMIASILEGVK